MARRLGAEGWGRDGPAAGGGGARAAGHLRAWAGLLELPQCGGLHAPHARAPPQARETVHYAVSHGPFQVQSGVQSFLLFLCDV